MQIEQSPSIGFWVTVRLVVVDVVLLMLTSGTLTSDTLTLVGRVGETVRRLPGPDTAVVDGVSLVVVDDDGLVSGELLVRSDILSVLVDVELLFRAEESSGSTVREALLGVVAPAARLDACRCAGLPAALCLGRTAGWPESSNDSTTLSSRSLMLCRRSVMRWALHISSGEPCRL